MDWTVVVPFVVPAVLALAWLLRLESRVNVHEAVCAERYKRLEERHDEAIDALRALDRKLDAMAR
jgi:hypothetical protein